MQRYEAYVVVCVPIIVEANQARLDTSRGLCTSDVGVDNREEYYAIDDDEWYNLHEMSSVVEGAHLPWQYVETLLDLGRLLEREALPPQAATVLHEIGTPPQAATQRTAPA